MSKVTAKFFVCLLMALTCLSAIFCLGRPILGQSLVAQDSHYLHQTWTTENGLPQNSVTSIVQTRDGYLWLGTFDGLARFDGVKFTVCEPSLIPCKTGYQRSFSSETRSRSP